MVESSLSITQTLIERTLVEKLRLVAVEYGYAADITKYPRTPEGEKSYRAEQKVVTNKKGFCIEVISNLNAIGEGEKRSPRMVVRTIQCIPGEFGQWGRTQYTLGEDGMFTRHDLPPQPVTYHINIHLVYSSLEQGRVLNAILAKAIPRRGYHKVEKLAFDNLPDELPTFFCELITSNMYPDPEHNLQEDVYRYQIPDAWDVVIVKSYPDKISPLLEVNGTIELVQINEVESYFHVSENNNTKQ